jgi:hypothetical protein
MLFMEYYFGLLERRPAMRAVELGVFQGGTAIALALKFKRLKIVSFDISPAAENRNVTDTIAALGLAERVKIHYGVSQTDKDTINRIVDHEFGGQTVELVIDDASHEYALSRRSFEIMLPHLSPKAAYVLEDWAWAHWGGENEVGGWRNQPGLTNLVFEWIMLLGSRNDVIASMEAHPGWVTLFRDSAARFGDVPLETLYRKREKDFVLI